MSARLIRRFVFVLLAAVLVVAPAFAAEPKRNLAVAKDPATATEQRVALVIGNSSYKSAPLANPVNDARAISAKLKSLGFEVIERQNLTQKQVGSVLREFRSKLKPGGVALFFYAGHGLQVKGVNYLPVVDADIASEEDVPTQSLDANKVLELMDEAKTRMNLVFLDACRNNPYARSFRSAADGLAKVNAPSGTIISFATRPGSVAADAGSGRNGLYTEHLLAAMDLPDTAIEQALKRVVSGVKQASKGRQEPWMEGSIEGDFYFRFTGQGAQPVKPPVAAVRVQTPEEVEQELWNAVKASRDKRDLEDYLKQYPKGRFAPLAQQKLKALVSAPTPQKPVAVASIAPLPATKPKPEPAVVGKVVRGWLGISTQEVTPELAKQFGLSEAKGALVSKVMDGTPAARAGLQSGDVITSLDGKAIDGPIALRDLVVQAPIGKSVKLEVLRDRKTISMHATVTEQPKEMAQTEEEAAQGEGIGGALTGIEVRSLTPDITRQFGLPPGSTGVVMSGVSPGSPAEGAGLQPGDVIVEINRQRVVSLTDFKRLTVTLGKKQKALLLIKRKGNMVFIAIKPSEDVEAKGLK